MSPSSADDVFYDRIFPPSASISLSVAASRLAETGTAVLSSGAKRAILNSSTSHRNPSTAAFRSAALSKAAG
jgi:hypothetical protein